MIVPVWTLATSCALKKHKVEFHHYRWNSHFLYTVCLRQIFRQRRLTCSLAKVFKLYTNVRLKSVKNSPSPKPTTSSTTLRKSSHFSCLSSFLLHFPIFLHFSPNLNFYLQISQKNRTFAGSITLSRICQYGEVKI